LPFGDGKMTSLTIMLSRLEATHQTTVMKDIIVIIIIIMWLVQWTLPFPRATSMPIDFVLDDRQLRDQC